MTVDTPMTGATLDPTDWKALRAQGHRMLDDMFDFLEGVRERPVWQPIPDAVRATFEEPLPVGETPLASVHGVFMDKILPYAVGNAHPGFMGWVHGAGTPVGMLAEMLSAGLNANVGGRDQIPLAVEAQVVRWMRELYDFPETASGVFVTGSSMANLIGVLVARRHALGDSVRVDGVRPDSERLIAYTSAAAHGCISQAMDIAGLGTAQLRKIPIRQDGTLDTTALEAAISTDREAGLTPFMVVGTAGSVDTGALDDLTAIAHVARRERLHFHVDGAFGALAMLAPSLAPRLAGIQWADSIAMDFHKWLQVPYDAGFVLVRDADLHLQTFSDQAQTYLARATRGMAAGSPWPCDLGPDLSRSFRALKTWFTFKVYGTARLGRAIETSCELARYMAERIDAEPRLELMAPVALNIVCFRLRGPARIVDAVNGELLIAIQESGVAAPSSTRVGGHLCIRAALFNHRTTARDVDDVLAAALRLGLPLLEAHPHFHEA